MYINPTQPIHQKASDVTGLKNVRGELFFNGEKVNSISLLETLNAFHQFLTISPNQCLLVAHNASFDALHLYDAVKNHHMLQNFNFIIGFTDTLSILRKRISGRKGEGMFKLSILDRDLLNVHSSEGFHEALYNMEILEKLTILKISKQDLFINRQCFFAPLIYPTLLKLESIISSAMIKKISKASITYNMMVKVYSEKGEIGLIKILSTNIGLNKPIVTKDKKTLKKIVDF